MSKSTVPETGLDTAAGFVSPSPLGLFPILLLEKNQTPKPIISTVGIKIQTSKGTLEKLKFILLPPSPLHFGSNGHDIPKYPFLLTLQLPMHPVQVLPQTLR